MSSQDNHISVGGELYDIGVPVVRWNRPGGLNGYGTKRVVVKIENRKTGKVVEKVIKGKRYTAKRGRYDWEPRTVNGIKTVIVHHTGGFTAHQAFDTLHNHRNLSCHFLISDKGVVYQTLDAVLTAWHAGKANFSSVGIECALYPDAEGRPDAYRQSRLDKLGLLPHAVIEHKIQGRVREVFAMPSPQVEAAASVVAGVWVAKYLHTDSAIKRDDLVGWSSMFSPKFISDENGEIETGYTDRWKEHRGIMLHANCSKRKWDAAGIRYGEFERIVAELFYLMLRERGLKK